MEHHIIHNTDHHLVGTQCSEVVATTIRLLGVVAVGLELEEGLRVGTLVHLVHRGLAQRVLRRVHLIGRRRLWQEHWLRIRHLLHLGQQLGLLLDATGRGEAVWMKTGLLNSINTQVFRSEDCSS